MIRVLVVDDHPLFRNGLTALLETLPDLVVVGDAGDGETAVSRAIELQPDVVLMDLNLPGTPGLEATRRIVAAAPGCAVLVVTMLADDASIAAAMRVGARGYVLKEAGQDEVLAAIRTVAAGGAVFGPGVAARLLDRPAGGTRAHRTRVGGPRAARRRALQRRDRPRARAEPEDGPEPRLQRARQAPGQGPHTGCVADAWTELTEPREGFEGPAVWTTRIREPRHTSLSSGVGGTRFSVSARLPISLPEAHRETTRIPACTAARRHLDGRADRRTRERVPGATSDHGCRAGRGEDRRGWSVALHHPRDEPHRRSREASCTAGTTSGEYGWGWVVRYEAIGESGLPVRAVAEHRRRPALLRRVQQLHDVLGRRVPVRHLQQPRHPGGVRR